MIKFKKIRWKNFLSTGNSFNEINLEKYKTTIITGDNGAGKSTMLDALSYALYGKSFRGINIGNLVNSINSKDSLVEIELEVGKNQYLIRRGQKPKIFEIHKNGEMLDQEAKSKDQQDILENQILRMSHKSFCQVVVLGSSNYIPFMKLPAKERRTIVENLLDIDIFSLMSSVARSKYSENKEQILVVDSKIDSLESSIDKIEHTISSLEEKKDKDKAWYQKEIDEAEKKIQTLDECVSKNRGLIEDLRTKTSSIESNRSDLDKSVVCKSKLEGALERCESDILKYQDSEKCPDCGQAISEEAKTEKVSSLLEKKQDLSDAIESIKKKISKTKHTIKEQEKILSQINDLEGDIISKSSSVSGYQEYVQKMKSSFDRDMDSDDEIIKELESVSSMKGDLESMKSERDHLVRHRTDLEVVQSLIKDSGIKSRIVKYYLPLMNKLINDFLKEMDFFCEFNLDENFEEKIRSRYRDDFSYFNFSEGERLRIDVSLLLAWREIARMKNSVNCNILILDEIFDSSLDSVGMEDFMKILRELKSESNIFVISHKPGTMNDRFDKHVEFKKKGLFSQVSRRPKNSSKSDN